MELTEDIWNETLKELVSTGVITKIAYESWLKPLHIEKIENDTVDLVFYSDTNADMIINYINKKFLFIVTKTILEKTGTEYKFHISVRKDERKASIEKEADHESENYIHSNLNKKYTFANFVEGENSQYAYAACQAVAEDPGNNFNPLYLYGGPGLGKTHLMQAVGNNILENNPDAKVIYVTSEEFVNEVIQSLSNKNNRFGISDFRDKYRKLDVLMVDDIQFIIGKEQTQLEFFHTFNALYEAGKQIIISSDQPPQDLKDLEERLRSRFSMGLQADIGIPNYETRMAILRKKIEGEEIKLSDEILDYIAKNITSNVRELEGALTKLLLFYRLEKTDITLDIAKKQLQNFISPTKSREITPQIIIEMVCDHYDLTMEQMISKNRSNYIAFPRQVAMYLCKTMTECSLETIGDLLGGKNHSTVIHGAKIIADKYEKDENIRKDIDAIKKKIDPSINSGLTAQSQIS